MHSLIRKSFAVKVIVMLTIALKSGCARQEIDNYQLYQEWLFLDGIEQCECRVRICPFIGNRYWWR